MSSTGEALSVSMARRTLLQRYEGPDEEGADDVAASQLGARVIELSHDGSDMQIAQVTQALIAQQVLAAKDVGELWPNAPQMQIAAAQMTAKANSLRIQGDVPQQPVTDRARREAG